MLGCARIHANFVDSTKCFVKNDDILKYVMRYRDFVLAKYLDMQHWNISYSYVAQNDTTNVLGHVVVITFPKI